MRKELPPAVLWGVLGVVVVVLVVIAYFMFREPSIPENLERPKPPPPPGGPASSG